MATNAFADVPNVILAGTLFMRQSHYAALTHLAQNRDVAHGLASDDDVKATEIGEHRHAILQAICRGRVRRSDGDRCFPMSAYIIAAPHSGIPDELTTVFPGATVKPWRAGKRQPTQRQGDALRAMEDALRTARWVSYRDVARTCGAEWANFKRTVVDHDAWPELIIDSPFKELTGPKKARGVSLRTAEGTRDGA